MDSNSHDAPDLSAENPLAPKRRAARRSRVLELEVRGIGTNAFRARTLNLSREGMFVEVSDPSFLPADVPKGIVSFAARAKEAFPHGLSAFFHQFGISLRADVVRVAQQPGRAEGTFGLGCRFANPLTDAQCTTLGILADTRAETTVEPEPASAAPEGVAASAAPRVDVAARAAPPPEPKPARVDGAKAPARRGAGLDLPPPRWVEAVPASATPVAAVARSQSDPANVLAAKRDEKRIEQRFEIVLHGAQGRWKARTADISAGGALVEIVDQDFLPAASRTLMDFASRAHDEFTQGATVEFVDGGLKVAAKVIRAVLGGDGIAGARIGLCFERPLLSSQCTTLGIAQTPSDRASDLGATTTSTLPTAAPAVEAPVAQAAPAAPAPASPTPTAPTPAGSAAAALAAAAARAVAGKTASAPAPTVKPDAPVAPRAAAPALGVADEVAATPALGGAAAAPTSPAPVAPVASPAPTVADGPKATTPPTPATKGDGSFADLLSSLSRRRGTSKPRAPVSAPKGAVLVHLFSRNGPLSGPRYVGVLQGVRAKAVHVDLDLPEGEDDPIAYAAGAGRDVRAVFLREGRVLWEVNARTAFVTDPGDPARVRLTLVPVRPPPKSLARRYEAKSA